MRQPRIKISPTLDQAVYHCWTRTVNKEPLIDDTAKEILRRQLWQVADYCGLQIVTYHILSNHFHLLLRVPKQEPVSDAELLRRYSVLYPKPTKYQAACLEVIKADLAQNGPPAIIWRRQQLALMGDVSPFMKLLKQRFSIWFNKTHERVGTLWAERFQSTLIEAREWAMQTMATYIDLNGVRAGLTLDPKDYRFCGYAEAVSGNPAAQDGIRLVVGGQSWDERQAHYRELLFGIGAAPREGAASIPMADFKRVLAAGGKLPLAAVLRCRIRHFTAGGVLGSKAFVQEQLAAYRQKMGRCQRTAPRPLPPWTDWGDLATLRSVRKRAIE